jgi:hypothetical protein
MGYLWEESAVNTITYVLASEQKKKLDVYLHFHALSDSKLVETLQLASDQSEPENLTLAFLNESIHHFAFVVIVKKATEFCALVFDPYRSYMMDVVISVVKRAVACFFWD